MPEYVPGVKGGEKGKGGRVYTPGIQRVREISLPQWALKDTDGTVSEDSGDALSIRANSNLGLSCPFYA